MDIKSFEIKEVKKNIIKKMSRKNIKKIILALVILVVVGGGIYLFLSKSGYIKTWQIAHQLQKQQQLSADDQKILAQLKKIMLLPEDITPTMAVINDAEALKKQQPGFFVDAKNGDHLIIYPSMAIIFDVGANKIIKVGPVQTVATKPAVDNTEGTTGTASVKK